MQVGVPSRRDYIHRAGRSGRTGREGDAWLLLHPGEQAAVEQAEAHLATTSAELKEPEHRQQMHHAAPSLAESHQNSRRTSMQLLQNHAKRHGDGAHARTV